MNAQTKIDAPTGLALLRQPFPAHHISKLPKATKAQNEAVKADYKKGIRCKICNGWHHPEVVHLDYVGHAALTDRLLEADPEWNWEPIAFGPDGLPVIDRNGGMWIKLTVCGQTRLGYGHADGKQGGDAVKEVIGDALRNAAMRFGAALDLWHKGDLHLDDDTPTADEGQSQQGAVSPPVNLPAMITDMQATNIQMLCKALGGDELQCLIAAHQVKHKHIQSINDLTKTQAEKAINRLNDKLAERAKAETEARAAQVGSFGEVLADEIPY